MNSYSDWTREGIATQRKLYMEQEQDTRQKYLQKLAALNEPERAEYEQIVKEASYYNGTVKMKRKFVGLLKYEIDHGIVIVNLLDRTPFRVQSKVDPEYLVTLEFSETNNPERGDTTCLK